MSLKPIRRLGCFAAVVMVVGCGARSAIEVPLGPVAKEIQTRGYRPEKSFVKPPTEWEVAKFGMRDRVWVAFKAEQQLRSDEAPVGEHDKKYYCRFALIEETYDSTADARRRLLQIHDEFPGGPGEDEYTRTLRDGFVVDRTLYVLQTDGSIFWPEVKRLIGSLAASRR